MFFISACLVCVLKFSASSSFQNRPSSNAPDYRIVTTVMKMRAVCMLVMPQLGWIRSDKLGPPAYIHNHTRDDDDNSDFDGNDDNDDDDKDDLQ